MSALEIWNGPAALALAEDCRAFLDDGTAPDWLCA